MKIIKVVVKTRFAHLTVDQTSSQEINYRERQIERSLVGPVLRFLMVHFLDSFQDFSGTILLVLDNRHVNDKAYMVTLSILRFSGYSFGSAYVQSGCVYVSEHLHLPFGRKKKHITKR